MQVLLGLSADLYLCSLIWETQGHRTPDVKTSYINIVREIHSQKPIYFLF